MITLALSKGRIFDDSLPLLRAAGIEVLEDPEKSRKLIIGTTRPDLRVVLVRASDVPTYVRHGGADLGVAGLDVLVEDQDPLGAAFGGGGLYRPLDLRIARCRACRRGRGESPPLNRPSVAPRGPLRAALVAHSRSSRVPRGP